MKELSTIEDEVFSSGMLGKGVAIEPDNGDVVSPVAGVVTTVFPTKHAIGLTSDDGVEILIHIGTERRKTEKPRRGMKRPETGRHLRGKHPQRERTGPTAMEFFRETLNKLY